MKLYHSPQTRSIRPRWLLEELGVPYDLETLDMAKQDHKRAEYMKIHPHGAVPALVDDDVVMFESAAICMYLADKYRDKQLAPALGSPERAAYYQWIVYSIATLEPPVLEVFLHTVMLPEEQRSAEAAQDGRTKFKDVGHVLSQALRGKEFLVGNRFSAADVMIGSTLAWAHFLGLLNDQHVLEDYAKRMSQRPAYQTAQG